MRMIDMTETKPCPFCGADAELKWVASEHGKAALVRCSREGECPSPEWTEDFSDHGDDAECIQSIVRFWNTRAEDWEPLEMNRMRMRVVALESENRTLRIERDRAMKACEQISERIGKAPE